MRTFKDGDLIATPHLPERGKVSIHVVDGDFPTCYRYHPADNDHLNHRIRVRRSYGLDGNISIYNTALSAWYAKLQWLRLPVLPIPDLESAFRSITRKLDDAPRLTFAVSPLEEHLSGLLDRVLKGLESDLRRTLNPNKSDLSFESLCERLLVKSGYTVVGRNVFDGEGGDVDIHCTRKRADASPFEDGDVTLYVQVKKHEGVTDDIAVRQLVKMMSKDSSADGCVMSLAEDFSQEAKELAEQNDILLMNGTAVCKLALNSMLGN
jgi:predicted Mrr-cat superfamily restriction endonuclease